MGHHSHRWRNRGFPREKRATEEEGWGGGREGGQEMAHRTGQGFMGTGEVRMLYKRGRWSQGRRGVCPPCVLCPSHFPPSIHPSAPQANMYWQPSEADQDPGILCWTSSLFYTQGNWESLPEDSQESVSVPHQTQVALILDATRHPGLAVGPSPKLESHQDSRHAVMSR